MYFAHTHHSPFPRARVYSSPGRRIRLSSARASHAYRQTSTHAYTHTSLGMFQPSWVSFLDWSQLKGMLLHHLQVFGLACGCVCQPGPEKFKRPRREKAETILPSRRLKEQSTGRRSTLRNIYHQFQPSWVSFLDWPELKGMLLHHLQVYIARRPGS